MKLFRFGERGYEKPGVILADGRKVDVAEAVGITTKRSSRIRLTS
jgi:hypothetical protein